jgi:hypothetical protein
VDEAKIVYHLNRMVEILLEEEDFTDNHKRGTGPCLEFFLQEKILEIWCGIGERDVRTVGLAIEMISDSFRME